MKKILLACIALAMAFACLGCSSGGASGEQQAAQKDSGNVKCSLGEEVSAENWTFMIEKAEFWGSEFKIQITDYASVSSNANEGMTWYVVSGQFKNLGGEAVSLSSLTASTLTVNGKYSYEGTCEFENANKVEPLQNGTFYVRFQVPDELADSMSSAVMTWTYRDIEVDGHMTTIGDDIVTYEIVLV